ncbi:MAG TPA: PrsW family intramembrane metalloprotease [Pyrinomonadaceae bacterium]|jgi:RsiW-degrading membrane proteinase PrsW (M82 family)|nr:PrsW family intramembrane metalloprotease [Pyrinomonadaceae bacterium]
MTYPNQQGPVAAPTIIITRPPRVSAIKVALGILAMLVASFLGLLVLVVIGIETGPVALLLGFIAATIPVPLYIILVLWIDRYEAEPLWMLATAFFWGALVATFFAFLLNTTSQGVVGALSNANAGEAFAAVISAPIVEETGKALILFIFFFWKKDEFDGVVDGIVYASLSALGFAMTENVLYYGKAATAGGGALTLIFIIRGFFAPFSHPLFTSMTGIGLGLARQSSNMFVKIVTPIIGLLTAIFMHSIWNGSAVIGGGPVFVLTYIVVMVPAFLIMLVVIGFALRREGKVVRQYLVIDLDRGFLTREEYDQVGSIFGRMGSSFRAFSQGGYKGWRARKRFNQLASELAFHRSRVSRGVCTAAEEARAQEAAYLQALQELVNELRRPAGLTAQE